ncbi:Oidioi.mRNA.OKI2018_I69.PAR.g11156.t1.cds [Oikopleura dioica]|uniref:Oidioi.mRNA.OKI2018_I69.PAR.g11156.t1.cds n=1 Tax=Oikopleura dioica TaxID=34765 RepID=A0ABN7RXL1_OIKDI|nr:Oidioi.mRNA.OKI2018_I69.PAR.g11156.t1.cds [Oikopleura dioica]
MEEVAAFYWNCRRYDVFGAMVTAWIWLCFNKAIIGVSFCYGSAITHRNVFYEYAVVWLICIINFIACCLIFTYYFDYGAISMLRGSLAMSCLALIFSTLLAIQVIRELCMSKNQQVRANAVAETNATTQFDQNGNLAPPPYQNQPQPQQQPVVVQTVAAPPPPPPVAPTYVRLPNGQLQLIQTVQQQTPQTVYVTNPAPQPVYPVKTSEQHFYSFAVAQTLLMMTNIAFSAICVGYLAYGLDQCYYY